MIVQSSFSREAKPIRFWYGVPVDVMTAWAAITGVAGLSLLREMHNGHIRVLIAEYSAPMTTPSCVLPKQNTARTKSTHFVVAHLDLYLSSEENKQLPWSRRRSSRDLPIIALPANSSAEQALATRFVRASGGG
jgi:hypothetical protein